MKYRDTYRIVTQVSRYVSHRDFRYRATPTIVLNDNYRTIEVKITITGKFENLSVLAET